MNKCVYVIPHAGNFHIQKGNAKGGSSSHIHIGIDELSKRFFLVPFVIERPITQKRFSEAKSASFTGNPVDSRKWIGVLRDIKTLFFNHTNFYRTYKFLKKEKPDVIYERSEYLNLNGIISAKILKIPHFYEANWVHYQGMQQFYLSYFNKIAKKIEEWMYRQSNTVFFVGNQHKLLSLKKNNWKVIQNGVSEAIVNSFREHNNLIGSEINICILASLMKHHRLDVFIDSLRHLKGKKKIKVHLIGMNFETYADLLPSDIDFVFYGAVAKEKVYEILKRMNIAVISGGPFYSSFMKLFDYAAAKIAVICPDLENIRNIFTTSEIVYFENNNSKDLSCKLDQLLENPEKIAEYGSSIYNRVSEKFTWEKIFDEIGGEMERNIK